MKPYLIQTDPKMPLTHRVALDANGKVDANTMDRLQWLATDYAYADPEDDADEMTRWKAEYDALLASVPAWGEEPYAEQVFISLGGGAFHKDVTLPEKTLRMHPDNVAKLDPEFLSKCEVKDVSSFVPFTLPA